MADVLMNLERDTEGSSEWPVLVGPGLLNGQRKDGHASFHRTCIQVGLARVFTQDVHRGWVS